LGNCVACHTVGALPEVQFPGDIAPPLDGVADRWTEAELRGIVANAKMTFDGSFMPAFYKTEGFIRPGGGYTGRAPEGDLPPILTGQQIEDVVAYLLTLKE
jgi:sulfur-oxidizing protein SoxX